jgi:adenosine kinase
VRIAIAGSVATDHLMTFPGQFANSLVADSLDKVSLSFLVDDLQIRRGGVAANIAFGMACLGLEPVLVAAVGSDWHEYEAWLRRHGVITDHVLVSTTQHTARFVCTTDQVLNQIASFYPGAMSEARDIKVEEIHDRVGGLDLVLIGPDDPLGMVRHTQACRDRGIAFAADPSQQLARMEGPQIRELIDGAAYLFLNEYESALIAQKSGWSDAEIMARVETRVTTHGSRGSVVERRGHEPIRVACPPEEAKADPTGVGDAFRSGFLAGLSWGVSDERCAQVGSMLATYVIETIGTQEYRLGRAGFLERFAATYGADAADDIAPHLKTPLP